MNFVAIDFETANYERTSACAIGLATVEDGKVVETFTSLIYPEPFWFVPRFTDLHGLSAQDVEHADHFGLLWPELRKRLAGRKLLAHNAPFDRGVLNACLRLHAIEFEQPEFICTCRLARAGLPECLNHRLDTVCRHLRIPLRHHVAASDAVACAQVALRLAQEKGLELAAGRLSPIAW